MPAVTMFMPLGSWEVNISMPNLQNQALKTCIQSGKYLNHAHHHAAAKLLKEREASLQGRIVLLFQPAEEGGAGGEYCITI